MVVSAVIAPTPNASSGMGKGISSSKGDGAGLSLATTAAGNAAITKDMIVADGCIGEGALKWLQKLWVGFTAWRLVLGHTLSPGYCSSGHSMGNTAIKESS